MKKIYILFVTLALVFIYSGCVQNYYRNSYQRQKIGVVKDANVIPTSFNETMKVQIKTDNQFFVVACNGEFPQLNIGDSLVGLFDNGKLEYIEDTRNILFKVR